MSDRSTHDRAAVLFLELAALPREAQDERLRGEADGGVRDAARAMLSGHDASAGPLDAPLVRQRDAADPPAQAASNRRF